VGVLLIIFGIILFIAEIKIVSHGMLTVAGIISLVLGSIMLFESPVPGLGLSFKVMIPTIVFISLFFIAVIGLAVKAQMGKVKTGLKGMIGLKGVTIGPVHASGKVFVRGEYWNASSRESLEEGEHIKVTGISGLNLEVERFEDQKGG
jgi:membrane-bound serine protease (ClpP class)